MPLYEFICTDCDLTFEELLRSADDTTRVTGPTCGGRKVKKIISTFASTNRGDGSFASGTSPAACSTGST